ncbi:unnamed protein product [Periconia digitata]|uniref:Uncharacterized protein n=1 Tax=Periconia digitata TaxID=1303443 RepID=A0A9W4U9H8_9PLEO|nr:unnamed protein product [Periconia digitata]
MAVSSTNNNYPSVRIHSTMVMPAIPSTHASKTATKPPRRPTLLKLKGSLLSHLKSRKSLTSNTTYLNPPKPPPLLALPLEIRRRIYTALFNILIPTNLTASSTPSTHHATFPLTSPPEFIYTSRTIYTESVPCLLRGTEIHIADILSASRLTFYLSRPGNLLVASGIAALSFSSDISWAPHTTHTCRKLLELCKGLRSVRVEVPAGVCVRDLGFGNMKGKRKGRRRVRVKSKKEIVESVDLCCLRDCEGLKKVVVVCVGGEKEARELGVQVEQVFEPVVGYVFLSFSPPLSSLVFFSSSFLMLWSSCGLFLGYGGGYSVTDFVRVCILGGFRNTFARILTGH